MEKAETIKKHDDNWARWVLGIMGLCAGCCLILIPASSLSKHDISMIIFGITQIMLGASYLWEASASGNKRKTPERMKCKINSCKSE